MRQLVLPLALLLANDDSAPLSFLVPSNPKKARHQSPPPHPHQLPLTTKHMF